MTAESGENNPQNDDDAPVKPRLGRAMAALMGEGRAAAPADPLPPASAGEAPAPDGEAETLPGQPGEHGGPKGPEPTRFGDWERKGRCIDF